jgi:hypothetical protein
VKLLYAIASALFYVAAPVAAPAQSLDLSLMSALCSDDYYEDTAGQCGAISAGEVFTIEAILAKYGVRLHAVVLKDGHRRAREADFEQARPDCIRQDAGRDGDAEAPAGLETDVEIGKRQHASQA